jgi:hypothetical protein
MTNEDLLEAFDASCMRITKQMNQALMDIDGSTHLPLWLQKYVNSPLFTISADTLQGVKIGLKVAQWELGKIIEEEKKDGVEER